MKKLHGLPEQIVSYLQRINSWASKGSLTADKVWMHQRGKHYGKRYLPETVGRALRSLEEQKIIAVRSSGISVEYRYLPSNLRVRYIPSSARPSGEERRIFTNAPSVVHETEVEILGEPSLPYKH